MFFLVRGLISIEKMLCLTTTDENDRKKVEYKNQEIAKLKAGSYFGELALLTNEPRKATCTAVSRCKVLFLDRKSFKRLLGKLEIILERNKEQYAALRDQGILQTPAAAV